MSPLKDIPNIYKMTASVADIQLFARGERTASGCSLRSAHTRTEKTNTLYLYGLAVVDFDDVEVKTVNSFARCNEITSLLVKIPPNIYKNLKERKKVSVIKQLSLILS